MKTRATFRMKTELENGFTVLTAKDVDDATYMTSFWYGDSRVQLVAESTRANLALATHERYVNYLDQIEVDNEVAQRTWDQMGAVREFGGLDKVETEGA